MRLVPEYWDRVAFERLSLVVQTRSGVMTAGSLDGEIGRDDGERVFVDDLVLPDRVVRAEQVHGNTVAVVGRTDLGRKLNGADGLVTAEADVWLEVRTADCVPVFVFDEDVSAVGLGHAGWQGVLAGLIGELIEVTSEAGADTSMLYAVLGPSIGGCCYTVDEERAGAFATRFENRDDVVLRDGEEVRVDLRAAVVDQLLEHGLGADRVWAPPVCTSCARDRYFSYRGDGGLVGHNRALIAKRSVERASG